MNRPGGLLGVFPPVCNPNTPVLKHGRRYTGSREHPPPAAETHAVEEQSGTGELRVKEGDERLAERTGDFDPPDTLTGRDRFNGTHQSIATYDLDKSSDVSLKPWLDASNVSVRVYYAVSEEIPRGNTCSEANDGKSKGCLMLPAWV